MRLEDEGRERIHFFPTFSLPEAPWFGGWLCPDNMVVMILWPLFFGSSCQWTLAEESEKAGLKLNIQKTKIMASGPITSWQIEGGKVEAVMNFLLLDSKITADSDCSHEIKRHLLFGRKAMRSLDCIKKQRHHFADKGLYSQSYGFSSSHVWM